MIPSNPARFFSRRSVLSLGAAGLAGVASSSALGQAWASAAPTAPTALDNAYAFLDSMMDLYASGSTLRLAQSYVPIAALDLGDVTFTYDNAVVLIAYLQRGTADGLARATTLGRSLVHAQAHDPIGDGRVRDSYHTHPFLKPSGKPNIDSAGSDCGNLAWTGLALCQLYQRLVASGDSATDVLDTALKIGNWIHTNCYDTRGAGGYTSGQNAKQKKLAYKSTELNVDIHALFTMLATLSNGATWAPRAAHAHAFVDSMFNASAGFFWVGTGTDGVTLNKDLKAEDTQSWTYLDSKSPTQAKSLDWAVKKLSRTDGAYTGTGFSTADTTGVWFEGTAHMCAALLLRNAAGDASRAQGWLASIELAQSNGVDGSRQGVPAASRKLPTGDGGDNYFVALHIGATAWYCIAKTKANPFRLP